MLLSNTKTRPTIGLLISHIDGTYQVRFWQGLLRFCSRHDCDLVVYASRLWRGQDRSSQDQEVMYRLANSHRIDALCIDTSAFLNQNDLDAYLLSSPELKRIPIVYSSIGGVDLPCVIPDNRGGIRQAMTHLVDVHNCSRIAFVGGPMDIEDARYRYEAFIEFAVERKIEIVPEWILEATFDLPSGKEATRKILESSAGIPEAIVFANDLMALGGLDVLKANNINVPSTVRVIGFDDDDLAIHATPTLSTVSQPIESKAWIAGRTLLDAINGLPLRQPPEINVKFLPRASCGCDHIHSKRLYGTYRNADKLLFDCKQAIHGISQVTELLGSVLTMSNLSAQLSRLIPVLGIGPTFVSLHDETVDSKLPTKYCYLVCAIGTDGTQYIDSDHPRRYLSEQIVPSVLQNKEDRSELFVQALYKAEKHFGFLTTKNTRAYPAVLVALRDHISEALFNIQHVNELAESQKAQTQALDRAVESERLFRELAQSLPTFIMATGPNGSIQYLNDTAKKLLEVSEAEIEAGLTIAQFIDRDSLHPDFSEIISTVPESMGYKNMLFKSRNGRKVALLMRSVELEARTERRNWSGLDYKPVLESLTRPDRHAIEQYGLTKREAQILGFELRGLVTKEIASELNISASTVKGHMGLLYRKLGVGSRDQLFRMVGKQIVAEYGFESLVFTLLAEVLRG